MNELRNIFVQCEDCPDIVDLENDHVALEDEAGEFFLHLECFVNGGWMRDDDIIGLAVTWSKINKN